MRETLKDAGKHSGTYGDGHYEATVNDDGSVIIETVCDNAAQKGTVKLTGEQWRRLAAWVAWGQSEWK